MQIPYRKPGKFSQTKLDPFLTKDKFDELKNKLEKLKNFNRPRAVEEVKRLAELGDFSENVEYQMAKGRLRGINEKILILENQLRHAEIIAPQTKIGAVQIGSTVTITDGKKEKTYQILGSSETNPEKGVISHNSPLGASLIGRKIGEKIKIKLADKKEVEYQIVKIK
ncbi:MAG: transcription elongation factor GreA [Candidatus Magasanikbacteria bacterium]|nr:transcription elongation factor GreA [Candidatus Magasanikbacteria bacterium]